MSTPKPPETDSAIRKESRARWAEYQKQFEGLTPEQKLKKLDDEARSFEAREQRIRALSSCTVDDILSIAANDTLLYMRSFYNDRITGGKLGHSATESRNLASAQFDFEIAQAKSLIGLAIDIERLEIARLAREAEQVSLAALKGMQGDELLEEKRFLDGVRDKAGLDLDTQPFNT